MFARTADSASILDNTLELVTIRLRQQVYFLFKYEVCII